MAKKKRKKRVPRTPLERIDLSLIDDRGIVVVKDVLDSSLAGDAAFTVRARGEAVETREARAGDGSWVCSGVGARVQSWPGRFTRALPPLSTPR